MGVAVPLIVAVLAMLFAAALVSMGQRAVSDVFVTMGFAFGILSVPIWMLTGGSKHESQPDRSGPQLRAHACRMPGVVPHSRPIRTLEVIVVDNSSTDGTVEIAQALADLTFDQKPERSAQRNRGAAESTGDIVVFIDSDMVLEPTVVADFVEVFERRPEVGAVIIPERSFGKASSRPAVCSRSLYVGDADVEAPCVPPGGVRRHRRLGRTLTAAEDWDLADRTKALGVIVDRIDSLIWHEGRIQLHVTYSKKQYYGRWVAEYLSRHPEGRAPWPGPVFSNRKPAHWPSIRSRPRVWCCSKVLRQPGLLRGMRRGCGMTLRVVHVIAEFSGHGRWGGPSPKRPSGCRASTS